MDKLLAPGGRKNRFFGRRIFWNRPGTLEKEHGGKGEVRLYHRLDREEVFSKLDSGPEGLSEIKAAARLRTAGPNILEAEERFKPLQALLHQFTDPLIYILLIAAAFTALIREFIDMWVILAVVIVNAVIGFTQELKAEQAIRSLAALTAPRAQVIRGGREVEIDGAGLVPGDIVLLASGARVPADLRLIEVNRLEIDESALTGESLGASKDVRPLPAERPALGDLKNMAFMGTLVLSGRGRGLVTGTGAATALGKISEQVQQVKPAPTPLQVQLGRFGRWLGYGILAVSGVAVLLGLALGRPVPEMLLTGIALAVGVIPEGLPVVVTLTMAIGVRRMARRNAVVRRLPAVETLGSTTVIASDKTGTLTKNEMTVQVIAAGGVTYQASGVGFAPEGRITGPDGEPARLQDHPALRLCLRAGLLANESKLGFEEGRGWFPQGDPTEVSLIVAARKAGMDPDREARSYAVVDQIPFESDLMYMASLCRHPRGEGKFVFVKGAPDRVLEMCTHVITGPGGEAAPLEDREAVLKQYRVLAGDGLRVLAFAYRKEPAAVEVLWPASVEEGLTLIGFQGMLDPPREEARHAINQAKQAGVRVIMVTGDHQSTAVAVARRLGMVRGEAVPVLTGPDIEDMPDEELNHKVRYVNVFARVAPLHKLRIVQQLIKRGEVVAVTGDGVNDSPALKAAHIGVAMGRTGTDAAKETSDMIVTDDNFAGIFAAVREGRVVFDNIRKSVLFLLSTGLAQIILIPAALVLLLPLPLLPAQILWLNLVTNVLQNAALAFEPGEKEIVNRPPRRRTEPVISRLMAERLLIIGAVIAAGTLYTFLWALNQGYGLEHARTVALTTIVFFQLFSVFNVRSEVESVFRMRLLSNPFLFFSVVASIIAQIAVVYLPAFQFVFRTAPLNTQDWLLITLTATTVIAAVEAEKALRRFVRVKRAEALARRR
jgi:Ca2+-transporting ATPase